MCDSKLDDLAKLQLLRWTGKATECLIVYLVVRQLSCQSA